jgi:hypothetical protein
MDDKDYVFKIPSMEDYIKSRKVKEFVPDLDVIYLPEGPVLFRSNHRTRWISSYSLSLMPVFGH